MKADRVTLKLEGEIPLDLFAKAVSALSDLMKALTHEVADGIDIEWIVDDLAGGSASATIVGQSSNLRAVAEIVDAYDRIGYSLQHREPIPYSAAVQRDAKRIASVLDDTISAVVWQDHTVFAEASKVSHLLEDIPVPDTYTSYGAVEGRVQTLSSRSGLHFTLYDTLNDRAVQCHLGAEQHDLMAPFWDKQAIVQGLITRDRTGRPTAIRQITHVEPVESGDFRRARGILAGKVTVEEPPEATVRRLRDAD